MKFICSFCSKFFRIEQKLNAHILFEHNILRSDCSTGIHLDKYNKMINARNTIRLIKRLLVRPGQRYDKIKMIAFWLRLYRQIREEFGYDKINISYPGQNYLDFLSEVSSYEQKEIQEIISGKIEVKL